MRYNIWTCHAFEIDVIHSFHFAKGVFIVDYFWISFDDKRHHQCHNNDLNQQRTSLSKLLHCRYYTTVCLYSSWPLSVCILHIMANIHLNYQQYNTIQWRLNLNDLIATLKPQSNGLSYSNTVFGTLAVDGWAVTFGTARTAKQGIGRGRSPPSPLLAVPNVTAHPSTASVPTSY